MNIYSGGIVNSTTINYGEMHIYGGVANYTTVNYGGMTIYSGGTANSTTINSGGWMTIYSGASADHTTNRWGRMYIFSGGIVNNTTVNSAGSMYISSGGIHRGDLQIESGAIVSAYSGAIIDFTLTDRTAEDGYLINDLSLITGAPTYTITV